MTGLPVRPILVTGASRGLGAALAEALAPRSHIIAVARTGGGLEALDDRIQAAGGSATLAPMDITHGDAMAHLCRSIFGRWGGLSLWVHTAVHTTPLSPADHIDPRDWAKVMDTLATGTATLIRMAAPLLQDAGAEAWFFNDPRIGQKFFGAYAAGKSAQMALVRCWAAECQRNGPDVRVLTPVPMATALRACFFPGEDRAVLAQPRAEARRLIAYAEQAPQCPPATDTIVP